MIPCFPLVNNQLNLYFFTTPTGKVEEIQSLFFLGGAEQSKNEPNQMIVLEWLFLTIAPCDAAEPWQLGSQDAETPIMQRITYLHYNVFFFVILIFFPYHGSWVVLYGISTIKKIQSRKGLFMELLSRFFGPYFLVSSLCSLLYHHLLCYTQWTR